MHAGERHCLHVQVRTAARPRSRGRGGGQNYPVMHPGVQLVYPGALVWMLTNSLVATTSVAAAIFTESLILAQDERWRRA